MLMQRGCIVGDRQHKWHPMLRSLGEALRNPVFGYITLVALIRVLVQVQVDSAGGRKVQRPIAPWQVILLRVKSLQAVRSQIGWFDRSTGVWLSVSVNMPWISPALTLRRHFTSGIAIGAV